jgi:hypothetical protein
VAIPSGGQQYEDLTVLGKTVMFMPNGDPDHF